MRTCHWWCIAAGGLIGASSQASFGVSRAHDFTGGATRFVALPSADEIAGVAAQLESKDFATMEKAVRTAAELVEKSAPEERALLLPLVRPLFSQAGWGGIARKSSAMAADFLVSIGKPAVPILLEKLKSDEARERWTSSEILTRIGEPTAPVVESLRPLIVDRDDYVRRTAIECLGKLGPVARPALDDLKKATNDQAGMNSVFALVAIVRIAGPSNEIIDRIASRLASEKDTAAFAADMLADIGLPAKRTEPALREALKRSEAQIRVNAAAALGRVGADSDATIEVLIDKLQHDEELEVRRSAAMALGDVGPKAKGAVPALRAALAGGAGWWVAAEALGKIGTPEAAAALREAVGNENADIRRTAEKWLKVIEEKGAAKP